MASEITLTIWADTPADLSLANRLAQEAAASVRRSTGLNAVAVTATARQVEPREVAEAAELRDDPPADLPRITTDDATHILANGVVKVKAANPVYLVQLDFEAVVETNEGPLRAHPGDWIAHDPISGHVWPVADSYVAQHYIDPENTPEAT